jgi:hypothetical protein
MKSNPRHGATRSQAGYSLRRAVVRIAARRHDGRPYGGLADAPVRRRNAADGDPVMASLGNGSRDRLYADQCCSGAPDIAARREER